MSSASFEVAFLPREEIAVYAKLNIYTSSGIFLYIVSRPLHPPRGAPFRHEGDPPTTPTEYRPPSGTGYPSMPPSSALSPSTTPIRTPSGSKGFVFFPFLFYFCLVQITSSGGNTHIELPYEVDPNLAGELPQYWDIRPYQTKTIGKALLVGHMLENSTSFVRINGAVLDSTGWEEQTVSLYSKDV